MKRVIALVFVVLVAASLSACAIYVPYYGHGYSHGRHWR